MHFTSNNERTEYLRELLAKPNLILKFTTHVRQRMRERGISEIDIRSILAVGSVIEYRTDDARGEKWQVRGSNIDDIAIDVVVAPGRGRQMITVVTAFWSQSP